MCNCAQPCTTCTPIQPCLGCGTTINTDCVIFNKEPLLGENVVPNSSRSLTNILQSITGNPAPLVSEFHTIGDGNFTLGANSSVIFLQDLESVTNVNATVTLPVGNLAYADKIYTFINTTPTASGAWSFNIPLPYGYNPVLTSPSYNIIVGALPSRVLRVAYIKTNAASYGWVVL
jgi:hypothetical protein